MVVFLNSPESALTFGGLSFPGYAYDMHCSLGRHMSSRTQLVHGRENNLLPAATGRFVRMFEAYYGVMDIKRSRVSFPVNG